METAKNNTTLDEKEQKALLKAQRKAEFEAKFKKDIKKTKKEDPNKNKSLLKAERRAKQEAQRAAKVSGQTQNSTKNNQPKTPSDTKKHESNVSKPASKTNNVSKSPTKNIVDLQKEKCVVETSKELPNRIFAHLPRRVLDLNDLSTVSIPPSVIKVGYKINQGLIKESTAKCVAMLMAFKSVIEEYQPPPKKDLKRQLQKILFNDCLKFLAKCRPLSISMTNSVKHLKLVFSRIPSDLSDSEVKKIICNAIEVFLDDEILCSWEAIVDFSLEKINQDDIILTLGCSTIMKHVLYNASKSSKKFKVIVVDTRPRFEGREMLEFLVKNDIPATYILINSISYVMKKVTKVIIEAHSLLGNGYVMSHIGSSQISLVAKAYNVPVIVCCETYKFSDRVHTDCFVHNELGEDAATFFDSLGKKNPIDSMENLNLNVLDLLYDLTPHEFVSVVITEKGILPCTSVPAILRVRETK